MMMRMMMWGAAGLLLVPLPLPSVATEGHSSAAAPPVALLAAATGWCGCG
jgi:hypothetical protein